MRISGLPIEYYDSKTLHFIGNRVGKTVKVDKNTLTQERGKYARLCVQVNLTKPLLAMFTIKDRKYNIEYEGLHLLCTTCGRFGHYKEGYPDKGREHAAKPDGQGRVGREEGNHHNIPGSGEEGPWRIVQKQRRGRKVSPAKNMVPEVNKDTPIKFNVPNISPGSRFASLSEDIPETNGENFNAEEITPETNMESNEGVRESQVDFEKRSQRVKNKRGNVGGGVTKGDVAEHNKKDFKLAARGNGNFKGKPGVHVRKGVENMDDKMGGRLIDNLMGHSKEPIGTSSGKVNNDNSSPDQNFNPPDGGNEDCNTVILPNRPRPPNWSVASFPITTTSIPSNDAVLVREGEVFLDADEQGSNASYEADMDIVVETPSLQQ
jgi:hypothetical protein